MSLSESAPVKRLILFDIDETMISSDGAGRRALQRALAQRHNIPEEFTHLPMSGKTDPQILSEIFAAASVTLEGEALQKEIQHVIEIYLEFLDEEIPASKYYIIHTGVPALLDRLSVEPGAYLGLLTGNVEAGARKKLKRFDLNRYFDIGAYGSDSASRLDLPAVAVKRALDHFNEQFAPEEVVIIGDSVNDIACAHHYGATALIANTGKTTWEELVAHKPKYLFKDLGNLDEVMTAIFN
ncbi:MAG: HAD family hydrolase [Cyanobacteria bacterium SZAS LIN-2]|nr:HAD family hydrolase [Cyanobacteria bacterium SZAS LIN-3]MBS1996328.1 HAD family hydrolase [Cyanobacteria bacterium SZAS LIN-2]MBS2006523.1 HAD family hydrolase [Cyanobacteria bacterium SZAS TMP-1]